MKKYGYIITGEYPKAEQVTNDFRDDVKVLDYTNTLEEAKRKAKQFNKDGFELVIIGKYQAISQ